MRGNKGNYISYIIVFFAILFWGTSFSFIKKAIAEISIPMLITIRALIGAGVLLFIIKEISWIKKFTLNQWKKICLLAFIGIVFQQLVQGYSLLNTSSNHAGLLISMIPIWAVILLKVFFKQKTSYSKWIGFLLGFIGVFFIFISKQSLIDGTTISTLKGDIIFTISSLNGALYVVLLGTWFKDFSPFKITFLFMGISALVMIPFDIGFGYWKDIFTISKTAWISVIYLGITCSGLAYAFYNYGVKNIGAARTSAFIYLQPLISIITAYLLLGEKLSLKAGMGGTLILIGLYYVNGGKFGMRLTKNTNNQIES